MSIGPIPAFVPLNTEPVQSESLRPPAIFEIDRSEKPGDEEAREQRGRGDASEGDAEETVEAEDAVSEEGVDAELKSVDYFA